MGYRIVTAPVLLELSCGHADGCTEELRITLDTSMADIFALAEGKTYARARGWSFEDQSSPRTLPRVYCPAHAPGQFRRGVLGMWRDE